MSESVLVFLATLSAARRARLIAGNHTPPLPPGCGWEGPHADVRTKALCVKVASKAAPSLHAFRCILDSTKTQSALSSGADNRLTSDGCAFLDWLAPTPENRRRSNFRKGFGGA